MENHGNVGGREMVTKKLFEYLNLLFEKIRLPNFQKARFCRQHLEIHGNLGGQEPGAKKQFEYLLFEKCDCPP